MFMYTYLFTFILFVVRHFIMLLLKDKKFKNLLHKNILRKFRFTKIYEAIDRNINS